MYVYSKSEQYSPGEIKQKTKTRKTKMLVSGALMIRRLEEENEELTCKGKNRKRKSKRVKYERGKGKK